MKFYMNNPCEVVRVINNQFSEVEVYHKFADKFSGADWCMACQLGDMDGAHPTHTCGEYQDVIDAINEENFSMLVVVENRLLNDSPIEFKVWEKVRKEIDALRQQKSTLLLEMSETREVHEALVAEANQLKEENDKLKDDWVIQQNRLSELGNKVSGATRSIEVVGDGHLKITEQELRSLVEDSVELRALEAGGVDNWVWYDESLPDDIFSEVNTEMEKYVK